MVLALQISFPMTNVIKNILMLSLNVSNKTEDGSINLTEDGKNVKV